MLPVACLPDWRLVSAFGFGTARDAPVLLALAEAQSPLTEGIPDWLALLSECMEGPWGRYGITCERMGPTLWA